MKHNLKTLLVVVFISSLMLSACGGSESEATPTLDLNAIQTAAIGTVSAGMTQTALAQPPTVPVQTNTPLPTFAQPTAQTGATPAATNVIASPTTSCYRLTFLKDVTIPDNTPMTPGQAFTKTWHVKNTGACSWDAGFKFAFTGGEAMSGQTLTLASAVAPNAETDLSINMVAPNKTGSVRGNWRMSTAGGQYFGDEVFVVINVGGATLTPTAGTATATSTTSSSTSTATSTATITATSTSTPTETPTATPTP